MNTQPNFRVKLLAQLVMSAMLATATTYSLAADVVDLGTVQSTADNAAASDNPASAPYQAPTQAPITATQPTSVINQHYIEENATAAGNFSDIAQIAPSVWSVDPNGPGMMESQAGGPFLRGFENGKYNVTFDGIPWGDSNDFTQHSTSYFMPQDTGSISVDRGPGTASTIGWAPFGGTIASTSKDPSASGFVMPYFTLGSWNTRLTGAEFDTGTMSNYGNATMMIDYKAFSTDGYLSYSNLKRQNLFTKLVKPISGNTVLTFVAMQNYVKQNVPYGATVAEVQTLGYNYGLSNNPASNDYYGYNYDEIHSDFEYIGIDSRQGNWKINNKVYTDAYYHSGWNGANPLDRADPASLGTIYSTTDVAGQHMNMNYRSIGDVLRLTDSMPSGDLNLGAWYDYQYNNRFEYNLDMTLGGAYIDPNAAPGSFVAGVTDPNAVAAASPDRLMSDTLTTMQPYVEYAWKATKQLTVTPGLKYVSFKRTIDATINDHTGEPLNFSHTWTKAEPSVVAHYAIHKNWSAYAQYAKGFLAPRLQLFGKGLTTGTQPDGSSLTPEETTNYQLGTAWASQRLALAADVYKIDFTNEIVPVASATQTIYESLGGATYKGLELEATYYLGAGVSLYGNYSNNSAKVSSDGSWVKNTPESTNALGLIYNKGPMYASLMAKTVGKRYGDDGNTIPLDAYTITNLSASYTIKHVANWAKSAKVSFNVNNLSDKKVAYALQDYNSAGDPAYFWTPERSYQVNVAFRF
jgi:iron complex outermembrane receptor protein